jgi:uncharacterized membrane protein YphA (DoxX/SURF4 family)
MLSVWLAVLVARVGVGSLLILAGSLKLSTGNGPRQSWLEVYGLLPNKLLPIAAFAIAAAELIAGAALFLGAFGGYGAGAAATVLGLITATAGVTLLRGKRPSCGCFGRLSRDLLSWRIVIRNLVLTAIVLAVVPLGDTAFSIAATPIVFEGLAVGVAAAVIAAHAVYAREFDILRRGIA